MQIRIQIQDDEIDASEFFDTAEDAQDWLIEHTDLADLEAEDDITFYHIGGYELLGDGTQSESFNTIEEMRDFLDDCDIKYDKSIVGMYDLAFSVEDQWEERYDDGGGSGWIE